MNMKKSMRMLRIAFLRAFPILIASLLLMSSSLGATSRVHPPTDKWAGALRVTEIMTLVTRAEIRSLGVHYDHIVSSGIRDSDLRDGSLAVGKNYCCGPTDAGTAMFLYIPYGIEVEVGDIVEVQMGRKPGRGDPGQVNTAIRVRVRRKCRWVPPGENLWHRTLYCDGMEAEGWIYRKGVRSTWMKPASSLTAEENADSSPRIPIPPLDLPTQLVEAAEEGKLQKVMELLSGGVDVDAKDSLGFSALMRAVDENHSEVVTLLMEKGADVNLTLEEFWGFTPLMIPLFSLPDGSRRTPPHDEMIRILLQNPDIDVNATDSDGFTVLMHAVAFKDLEAVEALLAHPRTKVNKLALFNSLTALDYAKGSKMKKVLIAAGGKKARDLE